MEADCEWFMFLHFFLFFFHQKISHLLLKNQMIFECLSSVSTVWTPHVRFSKWVKIFYLKYILSLNSTTSMATWYLNALNDVSSHCTTVLIINIFHIFNFFFFWKFLLKIFLFFQIRKKQIFVFYFYLLNWSIKSVLSLLMGFLMGITNRVNPDVWITKLYPS